MTKLVTDNEYCENQSFEEELNSQRDLHILVNNANKLHEKVLSTGIEELISMSLLNKEKALDLARYYNWCKI